MSRLLCIRQMGEPKVVSKRNVTGFTLLELMVVVAIAAILAALAFPSFTGTIRSNQVATGTNELLASLSLARSEAIRGTRSAGICASSDGATCGSDWNAGWLVWTDAGNTGLGTLGSGDTIVRYSQAKPKVSINTGTVAAFIFDSRGRMTARNSGGSVISASSPAIGLQSSVCPAGSQLVRSFNINTAGQIRVVKAGCA